MKNIYRYVRNLRQDLAGVLAEDEDLVVDDQLVPLQLPPTLRVKLLFLKDFLLCFLLILSIVNR